jgi:hypothetical protein
MFHSPFGPKVLEVDCPEEIVNAINLYVEYGDYDLSIFPNLLNRDFPNIFLPREFCEEIGLTSFIEMCGVEYLKENLELPDVEFDGRLYKDCWVNRYTEHHLTPVHTHDGLLSGILFLKTLPVDDTLRGVLEFIFGESNDYCFDRWRPEQIERKVLLFPSWLKHCVYPTQSLSERRTMSFNLR